MSDFGTPDHTNFDDGPGWEPAPPVPPAPIGAATEAETDGSDAQNKALADQVPEAPAPATPYGSDEQASPNPLNTAGSEVPYPKATVEQPEDPEAFEPQVQDVPESTKARVELVDDDTGFSHPLPNRKSVRTPWS